MDDVDFCLLLMVVVLWELLVVDAIDLLYFFIRFGQYIVGSIQARAVDFQNS